MAASSDVIVACARLVDRTGAQWFEIGHVEHEGETYWWASAKYQGAKIMVENHADPDGAALALAKRLLDGASCRCGQTVVINEEPGCRWRLMGDKWEPGCDAPAITPEPGTKRGDLAAMERAIKEKKQ